MDEFELEYGSAFAEHIAVLDPTFAKVLVRYNPEGDAALNKRQTIRLAQLSEHCQATSRRFMFELLVPATKIQMDRVQGDQATYDRQVRPELVLRTIRMLQDAGVAVIHGAAYGPGGEGTLRVSFASGGDTLARGLERLRAGLEAL